MILNDEQIEEIWNRISCALHHLCVPSCMVDSASYGCCRLCQHEFLSCPEKCQL
jgi:hypothetical protein